MSGTSFLLLLLLLLHKKHPSFISLGDPWGIFSPVIPTSSLLVSLGFHGQLCVLYYRVRVLCWSLPPPGPSDSGTTVGIPVFPLSSEGPGIWLDLMIFLLIGRHRLIESHGYVKPRRQ